MVSTVDLKLIGPEPLGPHYVEFVLNHHDWSGTKIESAFSRNQSHVRFMLVSLHRCSAQWVGNAGKVFPSRHHKQLKYAFLLANVDFSTLSVDVMLLCSKSLTRIQLF